MSGGSFHGSSSNDNGADPSTTSVFNQITQRLQNGAGFLRELIYNTKIEILAFGTASMVIGTPMLYKHQEEKENHRITVFSEQAHAKQPLTKILAAFSDVPMKISEDGNSAGQLDKEHKTFAKFFQKRILPELREHKQISEYAREMPQDYKNAMHSLQKLVNAEKELPPIIAALEASWSEDHDDEYHTEWYTEYSTDANGKTTSSLKSREVYDYTIHTYTYHSDEGNRAAELILDFVKRHPDLKIAEKLQLTNIVHEMNRKAILSTLTDKFKDKVATDADLVKEANTWAVGSNFAKYLPSIAPQYSNFANLAHQIDGARWSAKSDRYKTYSSYDSGPAELQLAKKAKDYALGVVRDSHKITDGIRFGAKGIMDLEKKLIAYNDYVLNSKGPIDKNKADKMLDGIFDLSISIYEKNFAKGYNMDPFSWGALIGLSLLIGLGGCAIGAGVDKGLDVLEAKRLQRKQERDRFKLG